MGDEEDTRLLLGDVTTMGCGVRTGALGSRETGRTWALPSGVAVRGGPLTSGGA